MTKTTYKYTVDLNRLINDRIIHKENIKKIGNERYKLKLEIMKTKGSLTKIEKEIDEMVLNYNKG